MKIETTIPLTPQEFNDNIVDTIKKKVHDIYYKKTFSLYGFISDIQDIHIDLDKNYLNIFNHMVNFPVSIKVDRVKPVIGGVYYSTISYIFEHGILAYIAPAIKVIITAGTMEGYVYDKDKNMFTSDENTLSLGSNIILSIKTYRFERDCFQCIGTFNEDVQGVNMNDQIHYEENSDNFGYVSSGEEDVIDDSDNGYISIDEDDDNDNDNDNMSVDIDYD